MDTIVVCSLAYILVIALIYAPQCPKTVTDPALDYVDYFPEVMEVEPETAIAFPPKPTATVEPPVVPSLTTMTIRQLKAMARGKIKNYSSLTKSQLIDCLAIAFL
jgi:hypothetical protein